MGRDCSVSLFIGIIVMMLWSADGFDGFLGLMASLFFGVVMLGVMFVVWRVMFTSFISLAKGGASSRKTKAEHSSDKGSPEQGTSTVVIGG